MRICNLLKAIMTGLLLLALLGCTFDQNMLVIDDVHGVLGETEAPVQVEVELKQSQLVAAEEGRLGLLDRSVKNKNSNLIPVQLENSERGTNAKVVVMIPEGPSGLRKFELVENNRSFDALMKASLDPKSGQIIIEENGEKVLQYNYQTVYEKNVIHNGNCNNKKIVYSDTMSGIYFEEYLKCHPEFPRDTIVSSAIYAIPRSDYIHPLYGLEGEMLTNDWPDAGHPHHRGIFWAWPEIENGTDRGDIYALQTVFARPTGHIEYTGGTVYAEIDAENLWMWQDREPVVRERIVIRVYHSSSDNRIIDLAICLLALKDDVTIATRFTDSYGGLNLRMQSPEEQKISYYSDVANANPLRAWSDYSGIFEGNKSASGLMVLQHRDNPDYPGDWVEYPDLGWVQPTFPAPGTRYLLGKEESLILRYRLVFHAGEEPDKVTSEKRWDAFHDASAPLFAF